MAASAACGPSCQCSPEPLQRHQLSEAKAVATAKARPVLGCPCRAGSPGGDPDRKSDDRLRLTELARRLEEDVDGEAQVEALAGVAERARSDVEAARVTGGPARPSRSGPLARYCSQAITKASAMASSRSS